MSSTRRQSAGVAATHRWIVLPRDFAALTQGAKTDRLQSSGDGCQGMGDQSTKSQATWRAISNAGTAFLVQLDLDRAGRMVGRRLQVCRVDPLLLQESGSLTAKWILSHAADDRRLGAQGRGMTGKIGRCSTESRTIRKNVPQDLANRCDS